MIPKELSKEKPKEIINKPIIKTYDIHFNDSPFNKSSNSIFQNNLNEISQKRRKLINYNLNNIYLPANDLLKVQKNFNKASPDDIVKNAAVKPKPEIKPVTEKLSNLSITPKINKFEKDLSIRQNSKKSSSLVIIGHVDAGKSTLTGRLLLDHNVISQQQYQKLKREAAKQNKASFSLAWLMDSTPEERERGVTIDSCASSFETSKYIFNIIDSPGHRDFIPNMISGVASTDIALLVVDASTDAFESGFTLDGQTKEHTILVKSLGVEKLIIAINKMDNVDWSFDRFKEIKDQLNEFFKNVGFNQENVYYVPISAFSGLNVSQPPSTEEEKRKLEWFKGGSIINTLESITANLSDKNINDKFIFSINDVSNLSSSLEISGKVNSGSISIQQKILILPSNQTSTIDQILINDKKSNVAISGDFVTFKIKTVETPTEIQKGDLLTIEPLPIVYKLKIKLILFDIKRPILIGTPLILFRGDLQIVSNVSKILTIFDKVSGEPINKKTPKHLKSNQVALIELNIDDKRGLPGITFKDDKILGRIVLRKDGDTIGAGVVEELCI